VRGIKHDILSVSLAASLDQMPVDYIGRLYRRRAPVDSDYITLKPGESLSGVVSLWDNYDISVTGRYAIQYKTAIFGEPREGKISENELSNLSDVSSNILYINIEGREPPPDPDDDDDEFWRVNGSNEKFKDCSTSEKNDIIESREHALNYCDDSYDYLILMAGTAMPRYVTWFGTFNQGRYNTVRDNFKKIRDAMDNATFKYYCNCDEPGTYAWVKRKKEYKIHLCPLFWTAPMTGQLSKADTLVHEVSHFKVTADTDDLEYGTTDSMNLAANNPGNAIKNADNYAFFSADTPYNPYNACAPTVLYFTGAQINATYDGANCQVLQIPSGTTGFVYNHNYYTNDVPGTSCPSPSWYDGANCFILTYPAWTTTYFLYAGNLYLTPGPGNSCPSPTWYDGANCFVMTMPQGSTPFKYANNLYITPPPHCLLGSYDGANCYVGTAPASRTPFIWSGWFYYHH
jgi:peptidyl-Lys metalloendopeptidase